ncbi:hypothetical protein [Kribbella sp. VKM Ac-2568]|uniref:hypothetical protein n=1 Tax=Kribbella sp. VKM Ac-2568 TaxID=2512219 RepID=UPI001047315F|nr:hypothetical protein [Kribbella sp. VKM Ac-2568]TCM42793.1 hypothetical protein EV648_110334 [Kribbella sp. VKM Ac-2568]
MLPLTTPVGAVRIVIGAIPITLLIALFALIMLISLALPRERREYVLQLAPIVVQLVRAIAKPSRSTAR